MGTIYYICFVPPKTGGEWVNVQTVATLNQCGVRAVALVNPDAQFDMLPHLPMQRLALGRQFTAQDIVVIPEYYQDAFQHFATQPCRQVIHTQGPFLTFRGFSEIEQLNAHGLMAGITCSSFAKQMMLDMGAQLNWQVVTPFVHPMFHQSGVSKKIQIAYMPEKRVKESAVIRALFRNFYPELQHVSWVPIAGLSRRACAAVMAESAVFASFSYLEGLGLPPLEAMASGCLVCGFTGGGGSDYANPNNGAWIQEGAWHEFAHVLAAQVKLAQAGGIVLQQQIMAGHRTVAAYSQARFERELLLAWQIILGDAWSSYLHE